MSTPKGWPTQEKDQRLIPQFSTVEPVRELQHGLSTIAHQFVSFVAAYSAESGSTKTEILATGHAARAGDIVRITSDVLAFREVKVYAVSGNVITLAEELPIVIPTGTTFDILRHKYPLVEPTGEVKVTGSISFSEEAVAADGGALPAKVKVTAGYDGSAVQVLKTDVNGELQVDVLSSALPSGAATSAAQTDGTQKSQIVDAGGDVADVKLLSVNLAGTDKGLVTNTIIHGETTGGGGGYVDVKVTPSGALTTESTLAGLDAAVIGQKTMANSLPVVIASNQSAIPISGSITVTDAANGTVGATAPTVANLSGGTDGSALRALKTDVNGELQIDVLSSALPTGAATADNQINGNQRVNLVGSGSNNVGAGLPFDPYSSITSYGLNTRAILYGRSVSGGEPTVIRTTDSLGRLSVDINSMPSGSASETTLSAINTKIPAQGQALMAASTPVVIASNQSAIPVSGTITATNTANGNTGAAVPVQATQIGGTDGTNLRGIKTDANGELQIDVLSSALPTGAATETTLASIDTKTPALGQALMAASTPVVIASNQTAIPVSGSFTAGKLSVVDLLDANILDTSVTNIPGSASSPVQVIASTAAEIKAIQLLDTTGAFVGVYVGGIGSEVLKFVMGPGSDQTIEHNIPAASRVSLKRLDSTAAVSSGIVAFNCMG